jgi:hypothetical protein
MLLPDISIYQLCVGLPQLVQLLAHLREYKKAIKTPFLSAL